MPELARMERAAVFVDAEKKEYIRRPHKIYTGNVGFVLLKRVPNTTVNTIVVSNGSSNDQIIPK
jgi:hypothetical protein